MLAVTPIYAGLLALLFVALSLRVIQNRIFRGIAIGDGGDMNTLKRIRVQANCAEYAPLGLLLLAMAELQGMPRWLVHLFGAMLLAGRVLHAYGLGSTPQVMLARRFGMALTITMITTVAVAMIAHALV